MSDLLTTREAGKRLGLSAGAIYNLIQRGILPSARIGTITGVPSEALDGLQLTYDEIAELIQQKKNQLVRATKEMNDHGSALRR